MSEKPPTSLPAHTAAPTIHNRTPAEDIRTAFFRATTLLRTALYIHREHTYDQPLTPSFPSGANPTVLHLTHDPTLAARPTPFPGLTYYPFPQRAAATAQTKHAVLASCMCESAAITMAPLIARLLARE